ncbi:P-loop NTPase family protein [Peribacillus muralis]|uniref:DNA replication protein n=1 Tax=Peribacillus muralis TaxID=264697 RepID=UPI00366DE977
MENQRETLENVCVLAANCKAAGSVNCNSTCWPYVVTHGASGKGGLWNSTNIPKKYKDRRAANMNLIASQNPQAYATAKMFVDNVVDYVEDGVGLFLYSIPNQDNRMGTGTGKTTVATTLLNEYTIARIKLHATGKKKLTVQPSYFLRASEFQNTHKAKYSGSEEARLMAAEKFSRLKALMMEVELLVVDDISLRNSTESLTDEFYEILDERNIEGLATILTSNQPIQKVGEMLSEQIASRIAGMCEMVGFVGKDNRKMF